MTTIEQLRRKADQHWELAGLARLDRDFADEARHMGLARELERKIREMKVFGKLKSEAASVALTATEQAEPAPAARSGGVKPLDEDDYEEIISTAANNMRKATSGIRGQMATVQDNLEWWVMKETERRILSALTTGKPDGEAVPSGTVEALKRIAQLKEVRRGGGVFDYEPALSAMEMYEIAFDALTADKPHPDDEAVDRFAAAMKAKLKWEREERGRHGWNDPEVCSEEYLAKLLIEHLAKGNEGNFEDVANICMMLHQRGAHPRVLADALTAGKPEQEGAALNKESQNDE